MFKRHVLLTGSLHRAGLAHAFHRAMRRIGGGGVIVAGPDRLTPVPGAAARAFRVPAPEAPGYVDELLSIAIAEDVGLIVPTGAVALRQLAHAASRFSMSGIRVAVCPADTIAICGDHYQFSRSLARQWIPAAESYLPLQLPPSAAFPLVVRPRYGTSDSPTFVARDATDLSFFLDYVRDPVVQPFVDAPQHALDVVCGFDGRPASIVPRDRMNPAAAALAVRCVNALPFVGALSIYYRIDAGRLVVTAIDPHLGDAFPLNGRAGRTAADRLVRLVWGRPRTPERLRPSFASAAFKSFVPDPISSSTALTDCIH